MIKIMIKTLINKIKIKNKSKVKTQKKVRRTVPEEKQGEQSKDNKQGDQPKDKKKVINPKRIKRVVNLDKKNGDRSQQQMKEKEGANDETNGQSEVKKSESENSDKKKTSYRSRMLLDQVDDSRKNINKTNK